MRLLDWLKLSVEGNSDSQLLHTLAGVSPSACCERVLAKAGTLRRFVIHAVMGTEIHRSDD